MIQRIHIFGASGSGTTSLAKSVADVMDMCNRAMHEKWISEFTAPFIRIEGTQSIEA
jgi:ABC-type dipeptide/oligopeptide/nickel transport system ATPase component